MIFFIIKTLILHNESHSPTIEPIGKIAGIKQITLKQTIDSANNINKKLWDDWLSITMAFIGTLVAYFTQSLFTRKRVIKDFNEYKFDLNNPGQVKSAFKINLLRNDRIMTFRAMNQLSLHDRDRVYEPIFSFFVEYGFNKLKEILELVYDDKKLNEYGNAYHLLPVEERENHLLYFLAAGNDFIYYSNSKFVADPEFKTKLGNFVTHVEANYWEGI